MTEFEQRALRMIEYFGGRVHALQVARKRALVSDEGGDEYWTAISEAITAVCPDGPGINIELPPEAANARD